MPAAATTFGRVISLRAVHEGRLNFVLFLRMYRNLTVKINVIVHKGEERQGGENPEDAICERAQRDEVC